MTKPYTTTAIDTIHTVFSKDGAKNSYLSMGDGPSVLEKGATRSRQGSQRLLSEVAAHQKFPPA